MEQCAQVKLQLMITYLIHDCDQVLMIAKENDLFYVGFEQRGKGLC